MNPIEKLASVALLETIVVGNNMKINDVLTLKIEDYDHEGRGVALYEGFPVFVEKALVGETILASVSYINSSYAKATIIKIIEESSKRNHKLCPYYASCGGCNIFHMDYEHQLEFKKNMVIKTFKNVARMDVKVNDVQRNPHPYHYRNKIIVPFGMKDGHVVSGFYEAKSHNIVPQDSCLIENELARPIINLIKDELEQRNVSIYDENTHTGLVRNVMIRATKNNDLMLVLVATRKNPVLNIILAKCFDTFKEIKSVYLNINDKKTNVILNQDGFIHILGEKYIIEEINDLKFMVHPNSFLQVNHDQAEAMYNKALSYIEPSKNNVIDAYCGIGSITLNLAKRASHVYGIEVVRQAIDNANENKRLNNINNASFICGKCEDEITKLSRLENIDTIVVDPPRKGCDTKFLDVIVKMKIKKIIYISCLTQSLARDAKYLSAYGYKVKEVTPFDLFSHSYHVECVTLLELKK